MTRLAEVCRQFRNRMGWNAFSGRAAQRTWFLLAGLPLLLAAAYVVWSLPLSSRRSSLGDNATTELFTWHAAHGTLLEGARNHFSFQFPGPMPFYCMAPLYAACGANSNAIFAAAPLINLLAVWAALFAVGRCADSAAALAWTLVLAIYQAFVGPQVVASPFLPWLAQLPFVATLVLCAAVAMGRLGYLPAALRGLLVRRANALGLRDLFGRGHAVEHSVMGGAAAHPRGGGNSTTAVRPVARAAAA